jgi:hypothetical protein
MDVPVRAGVGKEVGVIGLSAVEPGVGQLP